MLQKPCRQGGPGTPRVRTRARRIPLSRWRSLRLGAGWEARGFARRASAGRWSSAKRRPVTAKLNAAGYRGVDGAAVSGKDNGRHGRSGGRSGNRPAGPRICDPEGWWPHSRRAQQLCGDRGEGGCGVLVCLGEEALPRQAEGHRQEKGVATPERIRAVSGRRAGHAAGQGTALPRPLCAPNARSTEHPPSYDPTRNTLVTVLCYNVTRINPCEGGLSQSVLPIAAYCGGTRAASAVR